MAKTQMVQLAVFEPDQPGNFGAIVRLCACFDISLNIVGSLGFAFGNKQFKRTAMDYGLKTPIARHRDWHSFKQDRTQKKLPMPILLTTKASETYFSHKFDAKDCLLLGSESAGVPGYVHQDVSVRLRIPLCQTERSLNLVTAAAIVLSEALRQTSGFPPD